MRGRGSAELLTSPVFALSILVLLVNDHVLKAAWPGLISGKLSDVAGVAVISILAIALIRRVVVALGLTALAFTLLKTVPIVAVWAAPVLGGVTRTDPTDLVALAVLMPIGWWARRERPATTDRAWSLPAMVVLVTAAVFATTATSCGPEGVGSFGVVDGVVFASTSDGVYESADGGVTWEDTDLRSWDDEFDGVDFSEQERCLDNGSCFETTWASGDSDTRAVEEVRGGDRTTLLTMTQEQVRALSELVEPSCGDIYLGDVVAVERADGVHLVVGMGEAGVLHRQPDERWEWVAVGEFGLERSESESEPFGIEVVSFAGGDPWEGVPFQVATALLFLIGPITALAIVPIRRLARQNGRDPGTAIGLCVAAAMLLELVGMGLFLLTGIGNEHGPRVFVAIALLVVSVAVVTPLLIWQSRPRRVSTWQPPDVSRRVG